MPVSSPYHYDDPVVDVIDLESDEEVEECYDPAAVYYQSQVQPSNEDYIDIADDDTDPYENSTLARLPPGIVIQRV